MTDTDVTERWTAIGTRVTSDNKKAQAFLTPDGTEKVYAERATYVIGGLYEVKIRRDGERTIRVGDPRYAGRAGLDERAAWELESRAADAQLERLAAERKHKNDPALDRLLAPLEELAAGLRTAGQREAFASLIVQRVNNAYYRAQEKRWRAEAEQAGRVAAAAIRAARKDRK